MILGNSNHPVEIKKISLRLWSLRDEIECAIKSIKHDPSSQEFKSELENLKTFYQMSPRKLTKASEDGLGKAEEETDSETIVDEGMAAMAAALEGGDDDGEAGESEGGEQSEEDAAASQMALKMLADQAGDEAADSNETIRDRSTPLDKLNHGHTLLSDINLDTILTFTRHPYTIGQSIVIEFLIPQQFTMSAEVIACINISSRSSIISETKPRFRLMLDFTNIHAGERANLRAFLKSVEPTIPPPPKKITKDKDGDDDLDDELADFGF
ncbi:MAG: hypothetical protein ACI9QD_000248 [Thermoproteota archaeon]|jgi:hypothetical protein